MTFRNNELQNKRYYIFGAGGAASWVLNGMKGADVKIEGFLDDSISDGDIVRKSVGGIPVYGPDSSLISSGVRENSIVIFAIMNPKVDEANVADRLMELGWSQVLSISEFGKKYLQLTGKNCGMLIAPDLGGRENELNEVEALLSDPESIQVFKSFIAFVRDLDDSGFPKITPIPYFPKDIPRWGNPLRFIDCGAFDGDTMRMAHDCEYEIEASVSFEPDPKNFLALRQYVKNVPAAEAWPCGVSDSSKMMRFSAQGDTGSFVKLDGEIAIQCVAMDDVIPHFAPNLIKFDVEGSEFYALKGARDLIKKFRPGLAVSVYHLAEDIFRIPLLLSEVLGPNCKFYLRRHSRTIADTVLYVFPV
jgi:FkbM family methyltransferase